jgi:beta-N-acetylhexosaminidase
MFRKKLISKNLSAKANFGFASVVTLHFLFMSFQIFKSDDPFIPNENSFIKSVDNMPISSNVFNLNAEDEKWIEKTLASMPLYEKCTQIFMPAVFGNSLNQSSNEFKFALDLVKVHGIGGIVISTGNVEETASMINELQKNANVPLLVSADFENGIGMRIKAANLFPHNMAIGSTNNSIFAYQTGKATATESLLLGVNLNFAPVADINNNPNNPVINIRSYSENKNFVSEFCKSFVRGSLEGGVIATAKHFPGHGNTRVDSHNDLPIIRGSKEYLFKNELKPFIDLIENNIQAIMIGHLNVPAFDKEKNLPASLSYNIVTKLLKEKLGFEGLIITDALNMKAVTNFFKPGEECVQAFKAGNDILLMPVDIRAGITAIYNAVQSGEISEKRLNDSVRKILSAKRWLKLDKSKFKNIKSIPKRIRLQDHYHLSTIIAENSVTVVKINDSLLPLDSTKYMKTLLINISNRNSITDHHFNKIYNEQFPIYSGITLTSASVGTDYLFATDIARDCDMIILAAYFSVRNDINGKSLSDLQINFIDELLKLNKKVIIISFENPYILSLFPEAENYICTFSNSKASQRAALNLLNGSIQPKGRLPISIPKTEYKIGYKWKQNI